MSNDLQQIEQASSSSDDNPLRPKNFILAIGVVALCTASLACWLLFMELIFGKVRGAKELAAYSDVTVLGSLPKDGALPPDEEKDVLGVVALNYGKTPLPKGTVLVCRLPGSDPQPKFQSALDWSLSMGGLRQFTLNVVPSLGFEPPADASPMINAVRKGSVGWFPVENRYSLAPAEQQMLQADIEALRADFDCVFIFMPDGIRRGGSFFEQLLGVSDSVVIEVGADKTPRSWLAYARNCVIAVDRPMMGLVTDASASVVRKEMNKHK